MGRTLSLLILAATISGCKAQSPQPGRDAAGASAAGDVLTGSVQEHLNVSPYLYLRIKTAKGDVWAAVSEAAISDGAEVTVYNPTRMVNFESTALKRTFEEIYFGSLTPPAAQAGSPGPNPHASVQSPAPVNVGRVEKATGADARTVAEVWEQKASLVGRTVTIRGVVVKYNAGVMGKNWIHLQDGSGDAAKGSNDLTVTSLDAAAMGETVTIRGTVRTNKDFGAGYAYAVIVEEAKVVRE